jgi:preprotein translocase subunit SecG
MEFVRLILMGVLLIICVLLILLILVQKTKGGGMGAAFGGAGSDSILGPAGGNKITKITTMLAFLFMVMSFVLTFFLRPAPQIPDSVVNNSALAPITSTDVPDQPAVPPEGGGGEPAPDTP